MTFVPLCLARVPLDGSPDTLLVAEEPTTESDGPSSSTVPLPPPKPWSLEDGSGLPTLTPPTTGGGVPPNRHLGVDPASSPSTRFSDTPLPGLEDLPSLLARVPTEFSLTFCLLAGVIPSMGDRALARFRVAKLLKAGFGLHLLLSEGRPFLLEYGVVKYDGSGTELCKFDEWPTLDKGCLALVNGAGVFLSSEREILTHRALC